MEPLTASSCRAIRTALGLTQIELAALAGVAETTICHYECGYTTPRRHTIQCIKKALGDILHG